MAKFLSYHHNLIAIVTNAIRIVSLSWLGAYVNLSFPYGKATAPE